MSSKRFATTRLIAIAATVSICLCAFFSALALGEDTEAGAPPTLAPGQAPPLPKAGPLAEPRSQDQIGFPMELTKSVIPPGSPLTPSVVALGEKLFFDSRLSGDGTVACATCHDPALAFTDGRPVSIGIAGRAGQRNAPTILNALYNKTQFWDGRVDTLEEQAALPITNPFEMGAASVARRRHQHRERRRLSAAICTSLRTRRERKGPAHGHRHVRAHARVLRLSVRSFHRRRSERDQRCGQARMGNRSTPRRAAICVTPLTDNQRDVTVFTDNDFHNIGIGIIRHRVVPLAVQAERELAQGHLQDIDRAAIESETSVLGRFLITKKEADIASFKTPDLRNVLVTAPYFHDGSQQTLWDAVDHYNKGDGLANPWLDEDIQPLALTEPEIDDLVAFMASLTSPQYKELGEKEYARQLALSKTSRPQRDTARAFGPKPLRPKPPPLTPTQGEGGK